MFGFFSRLGNDLLYIIIMIGGGLLLFLGWRKSLISKGEKQAEAEANKHMIHKLIKAREAENAFRSKKGEDIIIDHSDIHNELMWRSEAITNGKRLSDVIQTYKDQ